MNNRDKFEVYANERGLSLAKNSDGTYKVWATLSAWVTWDAAVASVIGAEEVAQSLEDLTAYGFSGDASGFEFRRLVAGQYLRKSDVVDFLKANAARPVWTPFEEAVPEHGENILWHDPEHPERIGHAIYDADDGPEIWKGSSWVAVSALNKE